ncbi:hypothetical protein EKH79_03440 [Dyella dinghuensis]|uniref:Uncharacterized protein n=1 Tax=Dyella dinghuensis TaxID=1920169 RepID=A0A3S0PD28_9GAMM|nr:hypothetical protein [Dyella dinghuensis]RUL65778.1 hypothetical protein EKH79_03440 [Dyella dinghuensis]
MRMDFLLGTLLVMAGITAGTKAADPHTREYGDAQVQCATWTKLVTDPEQMKKPWSENVFFRYASWETGFVSGASAANPSLRTTTAPEIIKFVSHYCVRHPSDSLQQAGERYIDGLK